MMLCYEFRAFIRYMKAAFQTRFSKILNMSVDQRIRPTISFKTCDRPIETLSRYFETLNRAFKALGQTFEGLKEN